MIRCIRKPGITGYIQSDDFFSLTVTLALGYTHEARDQASFVHLLEHMLAENGVIHGKSIRNLLFQHDIDVSANTFPFHTEITLATDRQTAIVNRDLISDVIYLWQRPDIVSYGDRDLKLAATSIREEVFAKRDSGAFATIPWSIAPSLYSRHCEPGHDGFNQISPILDPQLSHKFCNFIESTKDVQTGVGIAGSEDLVELFLPNIDRPAGSSDALQKIVIGRPSGTVEVTDSRLTSPVVCDVYKLPVVDCLQSAFLWCFMFDNLLGGITCQGNVWQIGTFGPLCGPDFNIMTHTYEAPLYCSVGKIFESLPSISELALTALHAFSKYCAGVVSKSKIAARSSLFGVDYLQVGEKISDLVHNVQGQRRVGEELNAMLECLRQPSNAGILWSPATR